MAPEETERCIRLIRRLSEESGLTILFCEHDIALVFEIANRIMVMVRGATVVQGSGERCGATARSRAPTSERAADAGRPGIDTYYGQSHVLFDVSLSLRQGEIVGLLGRNGAGRRRR